jgi:hypothetical protein
MEYLPSGTNSFNVPIYNVFSQETPPAIADVSNLTSTLASKVDNTITSLPNFYNKSDINAIRLEIDRKFGDYYTTSQVDSAIDQKFLFSNPATDQFKRWIKLGSITYPTALLSDRLYSVMRIYFVQNVNSNEDYYMSVLFKFSSLVLGGSSGSPSRPMNASCEYTIHSKTTTTDYPKIVLTQDLLAMNTIFGIYMDMGTGTMPGGVFTPCKGMMLVNGTAPFVYDGSLNSAVNGGIQRTSIQLSPSEHYNPPTAETVVGFSDSVWDILYAESHTSKPGQHDQIF